MVFFGGMVGGPGSGGGGKRSWGWSGVGGVEWRSILVKAGAGERRGSLRSS